MSRANLDSCTSARCSSSSQGHLENSGRTCYQTLWGPRAGHSNTTRSQERATLASFPRPGNPLFPCCVCYFCVYKVNFRKKTGENERTKKIAHLISTLNGHLMSPLKIHLLRLCIRFSSFFRDSTSLCQESSVSSSFFTSTESSSCMFWERMGLRSILSAGERQTSSSSICRWNG